MLSDAPQNRPATNSLKAWWNHFTSAQKGKKEFEPYKTDDTVHTVFGKPLQESLQYASVQISTANANGDLYVWGYIPVVVAKCGLYLKENATEVEGTFRINGSNKRMKDLQAAFESPPRYGKPLDWKLETYTTHDVASVLRRYLTQMPEPVIPHGMYNDFRSALAKQPFNQDQVISTYKNLIRSLPRPNQYLLLYVLDLLSVFARKSEKNLMNASNLAVIFRPGIISHPDHEMLPKEHALSQQVLEFLIAQQDWFMLDIPSPENEPQSLIPAVGSASDSNSQISEGWRLVTKEDVRLSRRRTTIDRSEMPKHGALAEEDMSPSAGGPPSRASEQGAAGITRSRTMPSRRKGTEGSTATDRMKVLRKHKRASSSQPSRTGALEPRG